VKKLFIILLFASCWDGEINGRKYRLETPCIKSHTETYLQPMHIGKTTTLQLRTKEVCDEYGKTDTIWQKQ
jgi:hypothetical protein